jgi:aryl-alcohol dehydrogenase-like predicted oxidoreductase
MAQSLDLTFTPWGLLSGGALTGKYLGDSDEPRRYEGVGPRTNAVAGEIAAVAEEAGATPAQVAIAWARAQPWQLVPILGARTEGQMRENLGALELELAPEHLERLGRVDEFRLGFPRDFLEDDEVHELIFGDTFDLIDDHHSPAARAVPTAVA